MNSLCTWTKSEDVVLPGINGSKNRISISTSQMYKEIESIIFKDYIGVTGIFENRSNMIKKKKKK